MKADKLLAGQAGKTVKDSPFRCECGASVYYLGKAMSSGRVREIYWCDHCKEGFWVKVVREIPSEGKYKGCVCLFHYRVKVACSKSDCVSEDCESCCFALGEVK